MGMTPAVSLTSQSLDPVQAFAEDDPTASTLPTAAATFKYVKTGDTTETALSELIAGEGPYKVIATVTVPDTDNPGQSKDVTGYSLTIVDKTDPTNAPKNGEINTAGEYIVTVVPDEPATFVAPAPTSFAVKAAAQPETTTDITESMTVSFGPSQTAYTGAAIVSTPTVVATIDGKQVTIPANSVYTAWESATAGVELVKDEPQNAGIYNATVTVDYTVDGVTYTGEKKIQGALTVNPSSISTQYITFAGKQISNGATVSISSTETADTFIQNNVAVATSVAGNALIADTDYIVSVNEGAKTFTVAGIGNYAGSVTYNYTLSYALSDANVTVSNPADKAGAFTYNTAAQTPKVVVKDPSDQTGKAVLTEGTDYTVTYQQNGKDIAASAIVNAGDYTVVVKAVEGSGFTGEATATFNVAQFTLTDKNTTVSGIDNLVYTGETIAQPKDLAVTVNVNGKAVSLALTGDNADATVEWPANVVNANGKENPYELTVTGAGNYKTDAPLAFEFNVAGAPIAAKDITVDYDGPDADEATYALLPNDGTGVNVSGLITVKMGEKKLDEGTEYKLSIAGVTGTTVTEPGVVPVVVEGMGNYSGKQTVQVVICRNIEDATLTDLPTDLQWTGQPIKPTVDLNYQGQHLVEGTDYTVEYVNNTNAGVNTASVVITGTGTKWGGTAKYDFSIHGEKAFLSDVKAEAVTYNGSEQTPKITFTLKDASGKVISGVNPVIIPQGNDSYVDANTYSIKVAVEGKYEVDPAVIDFVINPANLSKMEVTPVYPDGSNAYLVGGKVTEVTPTFQTVLNGKTVTLTNNDIQSVSPITASQKVKVTGRGNYTNETEVAVNVLTNIDTVIVTPLEDVTYNGKAQTPEFKVYANESDQEAGDELVAASEDGKTENYTISWKNNTNAGTAQLVITGKGSYGGTKTVDFTINKAAATLEFDAPTGAVYTGSALKPEPVVTLKSDVATLTSGKDFTATYGYTNNTNAGTATITVNASGEAANNYAFEAVTKDWTIAAAPISGATYAGETTVAVGKKPAVKFTFNGKELKEGVDYKVIAAPIVSKEGKATLTVEGMGNFSGSKTITITVTNSAVTPGNPSKPSTPTVTAGWKKNSTGWWYVNANNSYPTNAWQKIDGKWFHFNKAGYMQTGWQKINGAWYYLNTKHDGTYGAMVTGWQKIDGQWFYFANSGAMQTGWQKIKGTWYLLNTQHDGTYGAMLTGWQKVDHATGKPTSANSWFYLTPGSGAMAASTWVGNYWVNHNGFWTSTR